jgi:hypothetical protein
MATSSSPFLFLLHWGSLLSAGAALAWEQRWTDRPFSRTGHPGPGSVALRWTLQQPS